MVSEQQVLKDIRSAILNARQTGASLSIRGGGSKHWYGESTKEQPLDAGAYSGIVSYDASELVITARCGTPLSEVEAALSERNQQLGFEPPHFGSVTTIGGTVAAGLCGPGRMAWGGIRDALLGVVIMNGTGEVMKFGGQVMKNVAGYDIARLMTGSMGALALILEVSLKVMPRPAEQTTLVLDKNEQDAIRMLTELRSKPLPVSATAWHENRLYLRLSGAASAVQIARKTLGGETLDGEETDSLWQSIRDQQHPYFHQDGAAALWRVATPPDATALDLDTQPLIEWYGGQRWYFSDMPDGQLRGRVEDVGGHATAFRQTSRKIPVFTRPDPVLMDIQKRLRLAFDPDGVFDANRLYADLQSCNQP